MNALTLRLLPIAALAALAGCAAQAPRTPAGYPPSPAIRAKEPLAMDAALKRARADLGCPAATGKLLSAQRLKPNFPGPRVQSPERGEFSIEASGCGKRQVLLVICAEDSTGCYVGGDSPR